MLENLKNRIHYQGSQSNYISNSMSARLNSRGGSDQWIRMRQDKLRSLKKSLLYSYQRAIVQKYDVKKQTKANKIIQLITRLQDQQELNNLQENFLTAIQEQYFIEEERGSLQYINQLNEIINTLTSSSEKFRCLINHDKLKVDYEDKIISIPFEDCPIDSQQIVETGFHNGTVFKWVHGNKEEWTPDTYWIVYMQYSEETAYFRAEIRKADEQIQIITVDEEGNQQSFLYRGWMTGPNETSILWNVKKNVVWNDMNYTKLLYITKDESTSTFFQRFDRVIIDGKPWQIQAYNQNYSTNKTGQVDSGIIRVALKETYTGTDQFIKQTLAEASQIQSEDSSTEPRIEGTTKALPYDTLTFVAKNFDEDKQWTLYDTTLAKIKNISEDGKTVKVDILTGFSNKQGFYINYGDSEDTKLHIVIGSF